ncbi:Endonuclease/exonuclease/phosphatase, partial [Trinorchestia longiramus]
FNAHNPAWFSSTNDDRAAARGINIISAIDSSPLFLLNQDSPTRLPSDGNPSSPDLTIVSPHLALETSWTPLTRLNSDHLPIAISLSTNQPPQQPPRRTFTNFNKANWEAFTIHTEEIFRNAP